MSPADTGAQARFDRAAGAWDDKPERVSMARVIAESIRESVPLRADMRVLDFGAGTGLVTLALLPAVREVTAVDASGEMLGVLREKVKALGLSAVQTLHGDIASAVLPESRFDLIVSSMVLHHLPDVRLVLRRLRPALRPGGWIALADLDAEDGSFHDDMSGVYHCGFERQAVCRWLEESGFSEPASRESHRMVRVGPDGERRTYPIFLITARAL